MNHITLPTILQVPLIALVMCAAFTDVKRRRIPNWLTALGVVVAFAIHIATSGLSGVQFAAQGMLTGFAVYLALYLLRALGAGDVKLMAAVGAFTGVSLWFDVFFVTAIVGATFALVQALLKGKLRPILSGTAFIAAELIRFRAPYWSRPSLDVKSESAITLPHGLAITAGVLCLIARAWLPSNFNS